MNTHHHILEKQSDQLAFASLSDSDLILLLKCEPMLQPLVCGILLQRHASRIRAQLGSVLRYVHDIDEVAQRVNVKMLQVIDRFESRAAFTSWLYRLVHNEALDYLRESSRYQAMLSRFEASEKQESFEEKVVLQQAVEHALQQLNKSDQMILKLRFFHDLSIREIAERLRLSLSAAKMRILRAIEKLGIIYKAQTA